MKEGALWGGEEGNRQNYAGHPPSLNVTISECPLRDGRPAGMTQEWPVVKAEEARLDQPATATIHFLSCRYATGILTQVSWIRVVFECICR